MGLNQTKRNQKSHILSPSQRADTVTQSDHLSPPKAIPDSREPSERWNFLDLDGLSTKMNDFNVKYTNILIFE